MIMMTIDQTRRTSWKSVEKLNDEIQIIMRMMKIIMMMTKITMITMTTDQTRRTSWQSVERQSRHLAAELLLV